MKGDELKENDMSLVTSDNDTNSINRDLNYLSLIDLPDVNEIPENLRIIPTEALDEVSAHLNFPIPNISSMKSKLLIELINLTFSTQILPAITISAAETPIPEILATKFERALQENNARIISSLVSEIISKCTNDRHQQHLYGTPTICRVLTSILSSSSTYEPALIRDVLVCLDLLIQCSDKRTSINMKILNLLTAAKAYEIILQLIQSHLRDEVVCEVACLVLAKIAFDKKHRLLLFQSGIFEVIGSLFKTHPNSIRVTQSVYHLLHQLINEDRCLHAFVDCNLFSSLSHIFQLSQRTHSEFLISSFCGLVGTLTMSDLGFNYLLQQSNQPIFQSFFQVPSIWNESEQTLSSFLTAFCQVTLCRFDSTLFDSRLWSQLAMLMEKVLLITQRNENCALSGMIALSTLLQLSNLSNYLLDECVCTESICNILVHHLTSATATATATASPPSPHESSLHRLICLNICGLVKANKSMSLLLVRKGICRSLVSNPDSLMSSTSLETLLPSLSAIHSLSSTCTQCQEEFVGLDLLTKLITLHGNQSFDQSLPLHLILDLLFDSRGRQLNNQMIQKLSSTQLLSSLLTFSDSDFTSGSSHSPNLQILKTILFGIYVTRNPIGRQIGIKCCDFLLDILQKKSNINPEIYLAYLIAFLGTSSNPQLLEVIKTKREVTVEIIASIFQQFAQSHRLLCLVAGRILLNLLSCQVIIPKLSPSTFLTPLLDALESALGVGVGVSVGADGRTEDLISCHTIISLLTFVDYNSSSQLTITVDSELRASYLRCFQILCNIFSLPKLGGGGERRLQHQVCQILLMISSLPNISLEFVMKEMSLLPLLKTIHSLQQKMIPGTSDAKIELFLLDSLYCQKGMVYAEEHGEFLTDILFFGIQFGDEIGLCCVFRILSHLPDLFWNELKISKSHYQTLQSRIVAFSSQDKGSHVLSLISSLQILHLLTSRHSSAFVEMVSLGLPQTLAEIAVKFAQSNEVLAHLLLQISSNFLHSYDELLIQCGLATLLDILPTFHLLLHRSFSSSASSDINSVMKICQVLLQISGVSSEASDRIISERIHLTLFHQFLSGGLEETAADPITPIVLQILANLAINEEFKQTVELSDIDLFVEKVIKFENVSLLTSGCQVLLAFLLSTEITPHATRDTMRSHFATPELLRHLKDLLQRYLHVEEFVVTSVALVKLLVTEPESIGVREAVGVSHWISIEGSVELVFTLITQYINNDQIIQSLVGTLIAMTKSESHQKDLISRGLCQYIVYILQKHFHQEQVVNQTCDCCLALIQRHNSHQQQHSALKIFSELRLFEELIPLWKRGSSSTFIIAKILASLSIPEESGDHGKFIPLIRQSLAESIATRNDELLIVSVNSISALIEIHQDSQLLLSSAGICELLSDYLHSHIPPSLSSLKHVIHSLKSMCQSSSSSSSNSVIVSKLLELSIPRKLQYFLELYSLDIPILEDIFTLLSFFLHANISCLAIHKFCPLVVASLKSFPSNPLIVDSSCRLLQIIGSISEFRNLVASEEICATLIHILRENENDINATTATYQALLLSSFLLESNPELAFIFHSQNLLPILLHLFRTHATSSLVVPTLATLLRQLSDLIAGPLWIHFHEYEGHLIIVNVVREFVKDHHSQLSASAAPFDSKPILASLCELITSLTLHSTSNQQDFAQVEVQTYLLTALKTYQSNSQFVGVVCHTLGSIASLASHVNLFSESAMVLLTGLLQHHQSSSSGIVWAICFVIQKLSILSKNCQLFLHHNGLSLVLSTFIDMALIDSRLTSSCCEIMKQILMSCSGNGHGSGSGNDCRDLFRQQEEQLARTLSHVLERYVGQLDVMHAIYSFLTVLVHNECIISQPSLFSNLSMSIQTVLSSPSGHTKEIFIEICQVFREVAMAPNHFSHFLSTEVFYLLVTTWENSYQGESLSVGKYWLDAITATLLTSTSVTSTTTSFSVQDVALEQAVYLLLKRDADQSEIFGAAILTTHALTQRSMESCKRFGYMGLCELLHSDISTYQRFPLILTRILLTMTTLASYSENQNRFLSCGTCDEISRLLSHSGGNSRGGVEQQQALCDLVSALSNGNAAVQDHLFKLGICDQLVGVMKSHPSGAGVDALISSASLGIAKVVEGRQLCGVWIMLGGYRQCHLTQLKKLCDDDQRHTFNFSFSILSATNILLRVSHDVQLFFSTPELIDLYLNLFMRTCNGDHRSESESKSKSKDDYSEVELAALHSKLLQILIYLFVEKAVVKTWVDSKLGHSIVNGMKRYSTSLENMEHSLTITKAILREDPSALPDDLSEVLLSTLSQFPAQQSDSKLIITLALACLHILLQLPPLDDDENQKSKSDNIHQFVVLGGAEKLVTLLVEYPQYAFSILTVFDHQHFLSELILLDCFERFVSSLIFISQSTDDLTLLRLSFKVMEEINESAQNLFRAQGVMGICVNSIRSHFQEQYIVTIGWKLILNLALVERSESNELVMIVQNEGLISLMIETLAAYGDKSVDLVGSCLQLVQEIYTSGSGGAEYATVFFEFGLHSWTSSLCKLYLKDHMVPFQVLSLVYSTCLVSNLELMHWQVVEIHQLILQILKTHLSNPEIILIGCRCLSLFSSCQGSNSFLTEDVLDLFVVDLLDKYRMNLEIFHVLIGLIHASCCLYHVSISTNTGQTLLSLLRHVLLDEEKLYHLEGLDLISQLLWHFCSISGDEKYTKIFVELIPQSLLFRIRSFKSLSEDTLYYLLMTLDSLTLHDEWIPVVDDSMTSNMLSLVECYEDEPRLLQYALPICSKFCIRQPRSPNLERVWQHMISRLEHFNETETTKKEGGECHMISILLFSMLSLCSRDCEATLVRIVDLTPINLFTSLYSKMTAADENEKTDLDHPNLYLENLFLLISVLCCVPPLQQSFQKSQLCPMMIQSLEHSTAVSFFGLSLECLLSILRTENHSRDLKVTLLSSESISSLVEISFQHFATDSDPQILMPLCRLMAGIVSEKREVCSLLCQRGLCPPIISRLKLSTTKGSHHNDINDYDYDSGNGHGHGMDPTGTALSIELCYFIKVLCLDESSLILMITEGLLDVVIDSLEANRSVDGIAVLLSDIVSNFMRPNNEEDRALFQDAVGKSGIFPTLIQSFPNHSDSLPILLNFLNVMTCLCEKHPNNRKLLFESGDVIKLLLQLLNNSSSHGTDTGTDSVVIGVCEFIQSYFTTTSSDAAADAANLFGEVMSRLNDTLSSDFILNSSKGHLRIVLKTMDTLVTAVATAGEAGDNQSSFLCLDNLIEIPIEVVNNFQLTTTRTAPTSAHAGASASAGGSVDVNASGGAGESEEDQILLLSLRILHHLIMQRPEVKQEDLEEETKGRRERKNDLLSTLRVAELHLSLFKILKSHPPRSHWILEMTLLLLNSYLQEIEETILFNLSRTELNALVATLLTQHSKDQRVIIPCLGVAFQITSLEENIPNLEKLRIAELVLDIAQIHRGRCEVYRAMLPVILNLFRRQSLLIYFQESNLCEWLIPLVATVLEDGNFLLPVLTLLKILLTYQSRNISLFTQLRGEQSILNGLVYWQERAGTGNFSLIRELSAVLLAVYQHCVPNGRAIFNPSKSCECMVFLLRSYGGKSDDFLEVLCDLICLLCDHSEAEIQSLHDEKILSILFDLLNHQMTTKMEQKLLCLIGALTPITRRNDLDDSLSQTLLKLETNKNVTSRLVNHFSSFAIKQHHPQPHPHPHAISSICQLCCLLLLLCSADPSGNTLKIPVMDLMTVLRKLLKEFSMNEKVVIHIFAVTCVISNNPTNNSLSSDSFSPFIDFSETAVSSLLHPSVMVSGTLLSKYSMILIHSLARNPSVSQRWAQAGISAVVAKTFEECQLHSDYSTLILCCRAICSLCKYSRSSFTQTDICQAIFISLKNHQGGSETIIEVLTTISELCGHGSAHGNGKGDRSKGDRSKGDDNEKGDVNGKGNGSKGDSHDNGKSDGNENGDRSKGEYSTSVSTVHLPTLEKFSELQIDKIIAILLENDSLSNQFGFAAVTALESLSNSSSMSQRMGDLGIWSILAEKFESYFSISEEFSLKALILCHNLLLTTGTEEQSTSSSSPSASYSSSLVSSASSSSSSSASASASSSSLTCSRLAQSKTLFTLFSIVKWYGEKSIHVTDLSARILCKLTKHADKKTLISICSPSPTSSSAPAHTPTPQQSRTEAIEVMTICNDLCVLLLHYHFSSKSISIHLCLTIHFLTLQINENKIKFHEVDVIQCLLQVLKEHVDDLEITEAACRALRSLSDHPPCAQSLAEGDFGQNSAQYLLQYLNSVDIVEHILCIIANMTSASSPSTSSSSPASTSTATATALGLGESRICEIIISATQKYQMNSSITISTFKIFTFLCSISGMTGYLGAIGSCKLLTSVAEKQFEVEETVQYACLACQHLCQNETNAKLFLQEKMHLLLVKLLQRQSYTNHLLISESILQSLDPLVRATVPLKEKLSITDFLQPISELCVTLMNIRANEIKITIMCCHVLTSLLIASSLLFTDQHHPKIYFQTLIEAGTVESLCPLLDRHHADASAVERILEVLSLMMKESSSLEIYFSRNLPSILTKISHSDYLPKLKSIWYCEIISSLASQMPDMFAEISLVCFVDALVKIIDTNISDSRLCSAACRALFHLSEIRSNTAAELFSLRCPPMICQALKVHLDAEIPTDTACQLISSLTRWNHLLPIFRDENLTDLMIQVARSHPNGDPSLWESILRSLKNLMSDRICLNQLITAGVVEIILLRAMEMWWESEKLMTLVTNCLSKVNAHSVCFILPTISSHLTLVRILKRYPQNDEIMEPLCDSLRLSIESTSQQDLIGATDIEMTLCLGLSLRIDQNQNLEKMTSSSASVSLSSVGGATGEGETSVGEEEVGREGAMGGGREGSTRDISRRENNSTVPTERTIIAILKLFLKLCCENLINLRKFGHAEFGSKLLSILISQEEASASSSQQVLPLLSFQCLDCFCYANENRKYFITKQHSVRILSVLRSMKRDTANCIACASALLKLLILSPSAEMKAQEIFCESGCLELLFEILQIHSSDEPTLDITASLFWKLCEDNEVCSLRASQISSCCLVFIDFLRIHSQHSNISLSLTCILNAILQIDHSKFSSLKHNHCDQLLFTQLSLHPHRTQPHRDIVYHTFQLLHTIFDLDLLLFDSSSLSSLSSSASSSSKSLQMVSSFLQTFKEDLSVLTEICGFLIPVTSKSFPNELEIFSQMKLCEEIPKILEYALLNKSLPLIHHNLLLVSNLCHKETGMGTGTAKGRNGNGTGNGNGYQLIKTFADQGLRGILVTIAKRVCLGSHGAGVDSSPELIQATLDALSSLLEATLDSPHSSSLSNSSGPSSTVSSCEFFCQEGACEVVMSIFKGHLLIPSVAYSCSRLISSLSTIDSCRHRFYKHGCCELMTQLLQKFPEDLKMTTVTVQSIIQLAALEEGCNYFAESQTLETLLKSFEMFVRADNGNGNVETSRLLCLAMDSLIQHNATLKRQLTTETAYSGFLEILVASYLNSHRSVVEVVEVCFQLISHFIQNNNKGSQQLLRLRLGHSQGSHGIGAWEIILECAMMNIRNGSVIRSTLEILLSLAAGATATAAEKHEDAISSIPEIKICELMNEIFGQFQQDCHLIRLACHTMTRICETATDGSHGSPSNFISSLFKSNFSTYLVPSLASQPHLHNLEVLKSGLRLLFILTKTSAEFRIQLNSMEIERLILFPSLSFDPMTPELITLICDIITLIKLEPNTTTPLLCGLGTNSSSGHGSPTSSNTALALVNGLNSFLSDEQILVSICKAIQALTSNACIENSIALCQAGICPSLIACFRLHCLSRALGEQICLTISRLIEGNPEALRGFLVPTSCQAVASFFQKYGTADYGCCVAACQLIKIFARSPTDRQLFSTLGVCGVLAMALDKFLKLKVAGEDEVRDNRGSESESGGRVGEFDCLNLIAATHALAFEHPSNTEILGTKGVCENMLIAMEKERDREGDRGIRGISLCLKVITCLATQELNSQRLGAAGVFKHLISALDSYFSETQVLRLVYKAISFLSLTVENKPLLHSTASSSFYSHSAEVLIKYMDDISLIQLICDSFLSLLSSLSAPSQSSLKSPVDPTTYLILISMREAKLPTILSSLLSLHSRVVITVSQVCRIIEVFAKVREGDGERMQSLLNFQEIGICERLVRCLEIHSQEHLLNIRICVTIRSIVALWSVHKYHFLELDLPQTLCNSLHFALEVEDVTFVEEILETIFVLVRDCCDSQEKFGQTEGGGGGQATATGGGGGGGGAGGGGGRATGGGGGVILLITDLLGAQNGAKIDEKCLRCIAALCRCGEELSTINERNCLLFGEADVFVSIINALQDHCSAAAAAGGRAGGVGVGDRDSSMRANSNGSSSSSSGSTSTSSTAIIISAFLAVKNVCSVPQNVSRIQEFSCCEHVTNLITSHLHDVKICEAGCAALASFVSKENFLSLYQSRLGDLLSNVLKRHLSQSKDLLKSISSYIVNTLSYSSGSGSGSSGSMSVPLDIFPLQLCGLLIEAWRRNMEDALTMELICLAIQRLSDLSLANRRELGVVGVIETILRGLKFHQKNAKVLPCAEAALRSLSQSCVENQERLSVTGGLEVLQSISSTSGVWFSAVGQAE